MPQIFFPGAPWAIAVEVGVLSYVATPGVISDFSFLPFSPAVNGAVSVAVLYYFYNVYVQKYMNNGILQSMNAV